MGLLDDRELFKQRSEIEAWRDIARLKGEDFMSGARVDGDLEPYRDKVMVDVGCGPRPFLEFFPARHAFMVDCCMLGYRSEGLLRDETVDAVACVDAMAEELPFRDASIDIVFAINMLDHTFQPNRVIAEFGRILKPGGMLHVHVDVGGEPNECEPVVFTDESLRALFDGFTPVHLERAAPSNPGRDHALRIIVARPGEEPSSAAPAERLDVMAAPGGGETLEAVASGLRDPETGIVYPIVDGVYDLRPRA